MRYRSPISSLRVHSIRPVRNILLIGLSLILCACARTVYAQGRPTKVTVSTVRVHDVEPTIRVVGTVRPWLRTVVAADVAGLVDSYPVEEGDIVEKGHLLCKLRDVTHAAAHAESLARQAELAAALEERKALEDKARFERERMAGLWELERSTEKEYRDAEADYRASVVRTHQAAHALRAQEAVVRTMADNLDRTRITAPFDGSVIAKRTEVGAWVDVGGEIVELMDLSTVRVRVNVPEAAVDHCHVGDDALVTVMATGGEYPAKVSRVIASGDERARTFPVEIDLPNSDRRLRPGMFVSAAVPSGPREARLIVPKDAVVLRGGTKLIFVVHSTEQGDMAIPMNVTVIAEIKDQVAVEAEGLADGDRVVVRGNEYMFGPSPVTITPTDEVNIDATNPRKVETSENQDVKTSKG